MPECVAAFLFPHFVHNALFIQILNEWFAIIVSITAMSVSNSGQIFLYVHKRPVNEFV